MTSALASISFSAPNRHHFAYDLVRFGLENDNEVFHADDRPYGLIEATVCREGVPARARPSTPAKAGDRAIRRLQGDFAASFQGNLRVRHRPDTH